MVLLILTWVMLGLVFLGIGILFIRWVSPPLENWFLAFWLGWAIFLILLQVENFFLPVSFWLWIPLTALAAPGWLLAGRQVRARGFRSSWGQGVLFLAALGCGVFLAAHAVQEVATIDTGKYHLPAMWWAIQLPVIPGLGNINRALGSSSAYFLYAALLNAGPWQGRPYHVASGVLIWALACQSLWQWRVWIASRGRHTSRYTVYSMLMLGPALLYAADLHFVGISPDTGVYALAIVLGGEWIRWLESKADVSGRDASAAGILLLASAGIALKQSFFVFGGLSILLVMVVWWKRAGFLAWKKAALGMAICASAILPALMRTALFSGYLLYPTTLGALPVAWRVPEDAVTTYADWVRQDARTPGLPKAIQETTTDWFPHWVTQVPRYILALAAASLILGLALGLRLISQGTGGFPIPWLSLPGILLASLIFWFFSAPDVRFAGSLFWVLGIVLAILAADVWGVADHRVGLFALPLLGVLLCGWAMAAGRGNFKTPASLFSVPDAAANPPFDSITIGSQITMRIPATGAVCWNLPQPCSEDYQFSLQLIDPNDLGRGFHIVTRQ
jgi:hypothetical protein